MGDDHAEIVPHGWNPSRSNSRRSAKRRRFRPASDTFRRYWGPGLVPPLELLGGGGVEMLVQ